MILASHLTCEDTYFCIAEVNVGLAADVRRPQYFAVAMPF